MGFGRVRILQPVGLWLVHNWHCGNGSMEAKMKRISGLKLFASSFVLAALGPQADLSYAQNPPPDHPSVTVAGQTFTPRSILARNMGTNEDQTTAFPPHKT